MIKRVICARDRDLLKKTKAFSCLLAKKYQIRKVYLFGSLAEGLILKGSDIDLAVEGMDLEDYLKALAEYREIKGRHLDLLHLDFCKPQLRQAVLKEGRLLYEKQ